MTKEMQRAADRSVRRPESLTANPAAALLWVGILINLALVPVASLIIVKKRAGAASSDGKEARAKL